jgi:ketosteroid isomerase-like protein
VGEAENRRAVERLIEGLNAGDVDVLDEVFTDDGVMVWPQSGEVINGKENRQAVYHAFPTLPSIKPYRVVSGGDLVVAEAVLDYGGDSYLVVFIFECSDGRIRRETAYWSKPFPAPAWRASWVETVAVPG